MVTFGKFILTLSPSTLSPMSDHYLVVRLPDMSGIEYQLQYFLKSRSDHLRLTAEEYRHFAASCFVLLIIDAFLTFKNGCTTARMRG